MSEENIRENLINLGYSATYMQVFSPDAMSADPEHMEWHMALTLGAALLMKKPIVFVVRPEDEDKVPGKVKLIADKFIVSDDASEIAQQLQQFHIEMEENGKDTHTDG